MQAKHTIVSSVLGVMLLAGAASACTDVVVGAKASADGSVITSHTADGAFYDAQVRFIPGGKHADGEMAPVFWNITNDESAEITKIGEIPQAPETYGYFHVGYPFMNEYGLAIGESTFAQKVEMKTFRPDARAILTIEQLEIFALQRTKTAREAIALIGSLAEKYGFLGSCDFEGESLTIADGKEAWLFEIRSAVMMWTPESGKPGAYWVAQRVPDDMVLITCNVARIQEVHPEDTDNFMASKDYRQFAIDMGWWDPASGVPFNWAKAYAPYTGGWALSSDWVRNRLYSLYRRLDPDREWDPLAEATSYPFAVKPGKKLSVQEVQAMLRSHHEGTQFDMYDADEWFIRKDGKLVKSPLASPFPTRDMRALLKMNYSRPVSVINCAYSFVAQARDGMPKPLSTILWFGFDAPHTTCYVPIYCGATDTKASWRQFDRDSYTPESAQWTFMLADDLVLKRYAEAMADLEAVRAPLEKSFFDETARIDKEGAELYKRDPAAATQMVTSFTLDCMDKAEKAWHQLNRTLITKYINNKKS